VGKSKYNVGDVVTVTGKIMKDDQDALPLKIECESGTHFYIKDVDVVSVEKPKLKVGDYVTVNGHEERGIGKIIHKTGNFYVRFSGEIVDIYSNDRLTRVDTPSDPTIGELKFKIGDRVIHKEYRSLGVGVIHETDCSSVPYSIKFSDSTYRWGRLATIEYAPVHAFQVGDYVTSKMFSGDGIGRIRKEKPSNEFWIEFEDTYHTCHVNDLTPATIPDFKIGVWVKSLAYPHRGVGKIVDTDDTFDQFNVRFEATTLWHSFKEMEIVPEPVAPAPVVRKFKIGDYVTSSDHAKEGIGEILFHDGSDHMPYRVKYESCDLWENEKDLTIAPKPVVHKFAVGDKVLHAVKGIEWGVGTVTRVNDDDFSLVDYLEPSEHTHVSEPGPYYDVQYAHENWASPERLLIKAKGI
jgi:hypothetical protein